MGRKSAVIHCNPKLTHQVELSSQLLDGLARHDISASIRGSAAGDADIHVVMGPHFAYRQWQNHPNVLYIDRAYWKDPECVSIHWLRNGEKHYARLGKYRWHPYTKPFKRGERVLILEDYDKFPDVAIQAKQVTVRPHPSRKAPVNTLQEDLDNHDIAIGCRTTALVDACINGLKVITDDLYSPVKPISGSVNLVEREIWLQDLAWHNWSRSEIINGDFLDAIGRYNNAE